MAFVAFSPQLALENSTTIPNIFMEEFLPILHGDVVKVYLFGLHICGSATRMDNTSKHFASILGLSEEDVKSAFISLEDHGLVQVLNLDPVEVRYLPIHSAVKKIKLIKKGSYDKFNANIQAVLEGKQITPTEFGAYYTLIESLRIEPDALVLVARYCRDIKPTAGYKYIERVVKEFAYEGARTAKAVKTRIKQLNIEEAGRELKKAKSKPHKTREYKKGDLDHLYTDLSKEGL
ncbi:MAG: DnaD domain protein [Firmicutes bacterium]|nr:DnaD domain protein [Bacillota bacterium]